MVFQHYEYALDKPPTILFRHQQGQTNIYKIKIVSEDYLLGRASKSWHFMSTLRQVRLIKYFLNILKIRFFFFCPLGVQSGGFRWYAMRLFMLFMYLATNVVPFPNLIYPMKDDYTKKFVILEITVVVSVEIKFELGQ